MSEIKTARLALDDCLTLTDYDNWRTLYGESATALWDNLSLAVARDISFLAKTMDDWEIDENVPPGFVRYLYPLDQEYSIQIYTERANARYKNVVVHHRPEKQKFAKTIFDINVKTDDWLSHRLRVFRLAIDTLELQRAVSIHESVLQTKILNPDETIWSF